MSIATPVTVEMNINLDACINKKSEKNAQKTE